MPSGAFAPMILAAKSADGFSDDGFLGDLQRRGFR